MNPDGQRFHLLLGERDWGACPVPGDPVRTLAEITAMEPPQRPARAPEWDADRQQVTLALQLDRLRGASTDVPLDLARRRAAAADLNGNIYWIGADPARLFVRSAGDGSTAAFWPDPRAAAAPRALFTDAARRAATPAAWRGLAVTEDSWLVAAGPAGLDSFDLIAGGPPVHFAWPRGFAPDVTDLAPRGRGLWLLDRAARRLYELDSAFALCGASGGAPEPDLFQPEAAGQRAHPSAASVAGFDLAASDPASDPIALEPLSPGVVAVLSYAPASIIVLRLRDGAVLAREPLDFVPYDMTVGGVLLRGGETERQLVVSGGSGNQLRAFRIVGEPGAETLFAATTIIPLRRYGGLALLNVQGNACYDTGPLPAFARAVEQPRQLFAAQAMLLAGPFDADTPQTVWDRLRLDGCIPPGTEVQVEACCGDDPALLGSWVRQPDPLLSPSGGELAGHGAAAIVPTDRRARTGTFELLLQRMQGRYLQLRLVLRGDGNASPHLRALRLSWPRISWAERYLPAVWRADPGPADFLGRFLANMQGTLSGIEARIVVAHVLLDSRTVPAEALPWLADWFDVALDPSWGEARSRAFTAHAFRFFGWRGTIKGLQSALALACGEPLDATLFGNGDCTCESAVRIVETYRTRAVPAAADYAAGEAERLRWVAFQAGLGRAAPMATLPRLSVPAAQAEDWRAFLQRPSPDRAAWQRLLAGRYRRIDALNAAHGTAWAVFGEVAPSAVPPATAAAVADWAQFTRTLVPMRNAAHRFTVLLPVRPGMPTDSASLRARSALAQRIIALEKPAHTIFDVRFYFAANRIGEARLGLDTAIGAGSRAPELLPPAILGRAYTGESFIGPDRPPHGPDRVELAC
ncbi:MAG: phage tail protein [Acetobacteraceae bacterium]|nr:phage tail protein [Acetobacteraceae bacterium]